MYKEYLDSEPSVQFECNSDNNETMDITLVGNNLWIRILDKITGHSASISISLNELEEVLQKFKNL